MAERKKRGLGRGLGALIPDANSNERPVDVFFSGGENEREGEQGQKTSRTRNDPAASMQSSRRRKARTGTAAKIGTAAETNTTEKTSGAAKSAGASKTSSSTKSSGTAKTSQASRTTGSAKGTASAATSRSTSAKTPASKSTGSNSTGRKASSTKTSTSTSAGRKTTGAKAAAGKPSASKAAPSTGSRSTAGAAKTSKASASAENSSSTASSSQRTPASTTPAPREKAASSRMSSSDANPAVSAEPIDAAGDAKTAQSASAGENPAVPEAPSSETPQSASESKADAPVASSESSQSREDVSQAASSDDGDVRETHPGVYTSSGYGRDDEPADQTVENGEAESAGQDAASTEDDRSSTTDVVTTPGEPVPSESTVGDVSSQAAPDSPAPETAQGGSETGDSSVGTGDDGESYDGVESIPDTEFGEIDVDLIDANPRQPRTVFDEDLLAELVHSIREIGVLQPVVVRQKPSDRSRFELIMGERRLRATKDAGLSTIPAIIRYVEDTDLLRDALLENLHRAELNPLEEAAAYGQLLEDFGCTQEELSDRIGRSRPQISNTLRLLRLPPLVQRRVAAGVISAGHARAILGLRDPEHMEVLAQRIVAEGLSVRASEEAVVLLNRGDSINVSRATSKVAPEFLAVAERLGDRLDTKVNISVGKKKGKLSVEFANQQDLDRILGLLGIDGDVSS